MKPSAYQELPALRSGFPLGKALPVFPAEPLWKRVPTRDESGVLLVDFMMIIPKLKTRPGQYIETAAKYIGGVLRRYEEVVFADVNLDLNVLWISHRYRPGLMLEIAGVIRLGLPEAVLIAHQCPTS